tara:strand:+ start:20949 stop:22715 length:1767 start_codon:yes stop_codon:yes gene_type:complete
MKTLKLLNRRYLSIIFITFFFFPTVNSEDRPIDIWNVDDKEIKQKSQNNSLNVIEDKKISETSIYELQANKQLESVEMESSLSSKELKIIGLYDPEDYNLKIDMWSNSNGDQLKYLFSNLDKINLSDDASELMKILLLTNAYYPNLNISEREFLKIKSDWLIKNKNRDLIEEYLIKNQIINLHPNLSKYLVDQYLSESNIAKACEIFSKNTEVINDEYLSKFNLYCLINEGKNDEAQLIFDLKKELGFKDKYFENKINFLFGFEDKVDSSISEKSILDFHLAHRTNSKFFYEPKKNTNEIIWKYLASSNLLYNIDEIEIDDIEKISLIEKATHDKNYSENDLFEIYKRFQFNIDQLLNASKAYKSLTNIEAKALIYQKILLESDSSNKLELMKILKDLFIKDKLENAFDEQLVVLLKGINPEEVPSNFTTFYFTYLENEKERKKDIKYNKDILHQSKLVNYFNGDYAKSKIEKDLDSFLKKIKKNKKYKISKKDIIMIESIRSDGIKIAKRYDELYELNDSEIPTDIQVMINNNEIGATILRIIEVIGQDKLELLDEDTLYFIISALNQLDIDYIRNKILLKVLPLKV